MIDARPLVAMLASLLIAGACQTVQAQDNGSANNTIGDGKMFFQSAVLTKFAENGCFKCHARGYVRPNVSYESMIRRLAIGDSAENNAVIYKIANVRSISPGMPNHPGGQRCATIDAEPCKSVRQWWEIEFGQEKAGK
jgi:hypothetical protein|tara:strand:- start:619 stop:1032 length:414 start_codon:yes stop_codon:yes gene_type:complete